MRVLLLSLALLAASCSPSEPPDPIAQYRESMRLVEAGRFMDYLEAYCGAEDLADLKHRMAEEHVGADEFAEYATKRGKMLLDYAPRIGGAVPRCFDESGDRVAYLVVEPPLNGTVGLLLFLEDGVWKTRNHSNVTVEDRDRLQEQGKID